MATQAARGKELIEAGKYQEAIEPLTTALKESPTSPNYLTLRALAYQRSQQYPEALADAEAAVAYAHKRAKKELILDAQIRRGIALHSLGRYGDARFVFDIVSRMNSEAKDIKLWVPRNDKKIEALGKDHEQVKVTVKEVPDIQETKSEESHEPTPATAAASTPAPARPQQTPVEKIRHDWYQNNQSIYITLLAKGVPADKTQVDITERSLTVSFPVATSGTTYDFTLDPLYAAIDATHSTTNVLPSKVEIILAKATPGQKWPALENPDPVSSSEPTASHATYTAPPPQPSGPSYPTSSRSGPKNWDSIGADEDEDEGGDATNAFFKKLYKDATPEVQRAMMKSFTESNGTALSTNWEEVSKKTVETLPPDGMEARKWGK